MRRQVAALARDRVSGATALARRAALLFRSAARDDGRGLGRWQRDLRALGEAVAAAQPAMGSVLTVVETARRAAEGARTVGVGARAVRRAMDRYVRWQAGAVERAARRLPALLPRRAICLTLSSSEVVYRALLAARRRGRLARVVVAESRPGCEGVAVARRLAARGVPVSLIVDALAPAVAGEWMSWCSARTRSRERRCGTSVARSAWRWRHRSRAGRRSWSRRGTACSHRGSRGGWPWQRRSRARSCHAPHAEFG
jgi:translation initiation factor 2B subunit (eIF-2B alpha/beta/delta family)